MRHFFLIPVLLLLAACADNSHVQIGRLRVSENQLRLAYRAAAEKDAAMRQPAGALKMLRAYIDSLYIVSLAWDAGIPQYPVYRKQLQWIYDYSVTKRLGHMNKKLTERDGALLKALCGTNRIEVWETATDTTLAGLIGGHLPEELYKRYFTAFDEQVLMKVGWKTDSSILRYHYMQISGVITLRALMECSMFHPLAKKVHSAKELGANLHMALVTDFKMRFAEAHRLVERDVADRHANYANRMYYYTFRDDHIRDSIAVSDHDVQAQYLTDTAKYRIPAGFQYRVYPYRSQRPDTAALKTLLVSRNVTDVPEDVVYAFSFATADSVIKKIGGRLHVYKLCKKLPGECRCPLGVLRKEITQRLTVQRWELAKAALLRKAKNKYPIKLPGAYASPDEFLKNRIISGTHLLN
jgi:hypothetical protein